MIGANPPSVSRIRSAGASSTSSPRRPALQNSVSSASAEESSTVGSRFFCLSGEMPPATYPVARSAAATSPSARRPPAHLPPPAAEGGGEGLEVQGRRHRHDPHGERAVDVGDQG